MEIAYPFQIDGLGRTATVSENDHIRHLIEQVLFTIPGERVNRPTFGSNIRQIIFAPNNSELVTATQFLLQGALEQWLGDVIQVEVIEATTTTISSDGDAVQVIVQYVVHQTQQRQIVQFTREV
ncbi:GPW/gp25 family protein [Leptolyngbya sp. FACHB-321]|jgi:phage baseplate assembly protein W|uniref:GPW/gp25 family protein n=1 Tax=Leptolyngbya sp. FACHB-321 TaxID=2692807 RepID=UPI001684A553|nr:GPW/gp25 family protein [Leptolyngbya sp. FACHB-321]MBD2034108.1 GPW/gp25 family protein [Leptolyngbya sp. FACHB-321]